MYPWWPCRDPYISFGWPYRPSIQINLMEWAICGFHPSLLALVVRFCWKYLQNTQILSGKYLKCSSNNQYWSTTPIINDTMWEFNLNQYLWAQETLTNQFSLQKPAKKLERGTNLHTHVNTKWILLNCLTYECIYIKYILH